MQRLFWIMRTDDAVEDREVSRMKNEKYLEKEYLKTDKYIPETENSDDRISPENEDQGAFAHQSDNPGMISLQNMDEVEENIPQQDEEEEEIHLPDVPELESPFCGKLDTVAYWGFSQRGESHIKEGLPCQDRCGIRVIKGHIPVLAAAAADGLGSCMLSDYGAAYAVRAALDYIEQEMTIYDGEGLEEEYMRKLLKTAMKYACDTVRAEAERMEQLLYSFQSTLTVTVYDGSNLYIAHTGDGGVVVLTEDGELSLATRRMKGEEASSVYPLQAGEKYWDFIKVRKNVNGFVIATDGVLDAVVGSARENNRVYYPFFETAFQVEDESEDGIREVQEFYYENMAGEEYRRRVTDDLTLVVVTNLKYIKESLPEFDKEKWDKETEERVARIHAALYPGTSAPRRKTDANPDLKLLCPGCGVAVFPQYRYCPFCGRGLPYLQKKSVTPDRMSRAAAGPVTTPVKRRDREGQEHMLEKNSREHAEKRPEIKYPEGGQPGERRWKRRSDEKYMQDKRQREKIVQKTWNLLINILTVFMICGFLVAVWVLTNIFLPF